MLNRTLFGIGIVLLAGSLFVLFGCSRQGVYSQISIISVPVNTEYRDD